MKLHGIVRDRRETPVAGADVWVEMLVDGALDRIAACRSDDRGAYALESLPLAGMNALEFEAARPALCAWAPGYALERDDRGCIVDFLYDLNEREDEPWDIDLEPGGIVEGRVVDRAGRPVPGAEVRPHWGHTATDAQGEYRLGTNVFYGSVAARKAQVGVAALEGCSFRKSGSTRIPDMVLVGEGVIEVRLVSPDGAPLADTWVYLWREYEDPVELVRDRRRREALGLPELSEPVGLEKSRVQTDGSGWLRAEGLMPGRFRLSRGEIIAVGLELVCATGEPPREMIVAGARVRVRVLDAAGTPSGDNELHWSAWESEAGPQLAALVDSGKAGDLFEQKLGVQFRHYVDDLGPVFSMVVPRGTWWYGRTDMRYGTSPVERLFLVGSHESDLAVDFQRDESESIGEVRIEVMDEAGRPWPDDWRLRMWTPMGARVVDAHATGSASFFKRLPPGLYELELADRECGTVTRNPQRCCAGFRDRVRVESGRTAEVRLVVRPAGHLVLLIRTADGKPSELRRGIGCAIGYGSAPDYVTLVSLDGAVSWTLDRFANTYGISPLAMEDKPNLNPHCASVATGHPPPGSYTVHVDLPGYEAASAPVMIAESRTSVVDLVLRENK